MKKIFNLIIILFFILVPCKTTSANENKLTYEGDVVAKYDLYENSDVVFDDFFSMGIFILMILK